MHIVSLAMHICILKRKLFFTNCTTSNDSPSIVNILYQNLEQVNRFWSPNLRFEFLRGACSSGWVHAFSLRSTIDRSVVRGDRFVGGRSNRFSGLLSGSIYEIIIRPTIKRSKRWPREFEACRVCSDWNAPGNFRLFGACNYARDAVH